MSDLISRQAAIDEIHEDAEWLASQGSDWQVERMERDKSILMSLPSVQPERNMGHWIKTARWGSVYYCDQCRNYLDFDGVNAGRGSTNFCPNCGADMRGDKHEAD